MSDIIKRLRYGCSDPDALLQEAADKIEDMQAELVAAQAENERLRGALEEVRLCGFEVQRCVGEQWQFVVKDALATPSDNTALKERLRAERERCAKYCEGTFELGGDALNCAAGIRALEGEK